MVARLKKILITVLTVLILSTGSSAWAAFYQFAPTPKDIFDLDHFKYYTWGINWTPAPYEKIISAQIFIKNIDNWIAEQDILYIELLDTAAFGVTTFTDNQAVGNGLADWAGNNTTLTTYTDLQDAGFPENFNYSFDANELAYLNSWFADGNIGLGFDPDCHYWNDGVKFKFNTRIVTPEPGTIALFASGLIGSLGLRRKKKIS